MENLFDIAFFCLENDNVFFRGLDSGKKYGEYSCPLFEGMIARTAVAYLSIPNRKYVLEDEKLYLVEGSRKTEVKVYKIGRNYYWDFSGWHWVKHPIK